MNDKQHNKIKRFLESVRNENPLAIVVMAYSADNKLHIEAQGSDDAIGQIYMATYSTVKESIDRGLVMEAK